MRYQLNFDNVRKMAYSFNMWIHNFKNILYSNCCFESKEFPDETIITASTAVPNYGIQYITRDSYYFYKLGLDKLSLEDVIPHTFLIDKESQNFNTYTILLTLKNKNEVDSKSL